MHLNWHWYLEPEDLRISLIYDVISIQSLSRQDLYFFISAMPRSRLVVEGLQLHLLSISVCRQSFKQAWMRKNERSNGYARYCANQFVLSKLLIVAHCVKVDTYWYSVADSKQIEKFFASITRTIWLRSSMDRLLIKTIDVHI